MNAGTNAGKTLADIHLEERNPLMWTAEEGKPSLSLGVGQWHSPCPKEHTQAWPVFAHHEFSCRNQT